MKKIIAITGGIGSGKSIALKIVKKLGYKALNADLVYKNLLRQKRFVTEISSLLAIKPLAKGNRLFLDKTAVSKAVFLDKEKLKALNSFTHPKIMDKMFLLARKFEGIVFCEVPLLYEGGFESLFDAVLVIKRNDSDRFLSASIRDGKTVTQIENIARNQFDYTKIEQNEHTFIIENDGDVNALTEKIKVVIEKIT